MLPQHLYQSKNVSNWEELVGTFERLLRTEDIVAREWLFRGQKQPSPGDKFDLITSLERAAGSFNLTDRYRLSEIEAKLQREFKRRLHHYTIHTPEEDDPLEVSALMQHYGAPTRLLDWTYSFYIATFFAVEEYSDTGYEVWALNRNWFSAETIAPDRVCELRRQAQELALAEHKDIATGQQQAIIDYLVTNRVCAVQSVNPFRLNERLTIQRGVFLFPGDIDHSFEQNLAADGYASKSADNLYRFRIDKQARAEILQRLHVMNIDNATLFPGLDGFARSLATRLASMDRLR